MVVATLLILIGSWSAFSDALPQVGDPFQDEPDQCEIKVSTEMLQSLTDSIRMEMLCDNLFTNLLQHFHDTRQNLTDCLAREGSISATETSSTFCQLLLDDAQRQMEQERRKYTAEMEAQLHTVQQEAQKYNDEYVALQGNLNNLLENRTELYLDLLLTNIAIGDVKQAHKYYHLYLENKPADKLYDHIVRSVYRVSKYQNQRLINLIHFIREISDTKPRVTLYRLVKIEMMKRPSQRDSYLSAIFALNVNADSTVRAADQSLFSDMMGMIEKRWKDQIVAGNFQEVANFAGNQPKYFELMQERLATVDNNLWQKLKFDKFVMYPNSLPRSNQRLEAFQHILRQIEERSKKNSHTFLIQTAHQLNICEEFIKKSNSDQKVKQMLEQMKRKFAQFSSNKGYDYYLKESRKPSKG
ncbi:uncharacterized protein LOC128729079 [Anopheles nili]|uniref:uncharacterized protein LOC128729079 n=1 Tax=Anopheles nili TaxID=185578 RepID=UPI00237B47AF|nr:uncharacterized protein LOC128729079 [Anopheles nili]